MKKLILFSALAFGLNAFGQDEYRDANAQEIYSDCIAEVMPASNADECNCHLKLSDSLDLILNKLYQEKEGVLTETLKSDLYLEDEILYDAAIEQLKSLTTLKISFLMQRAALINIDEQAGVYGNSCFSLVTGNRITIDHINLIKELDLLSEE